jgi:hypothetical protein
MREIGKQTAMQSIIGVYKGGYKEDWVFSQWYEKAILVFCVLYTGISIVRWIF